MPKFNFQIAYGVSETPVRWFACPVKYRDLDEAIEWANKTFENGVQVAIIDVSGYIIERFVVPKIDDDGHNLPKYPWLKGNDDGV